MKPAFSCIRFSKTDKSRCNGQKVGFLSYFQRSLCLKKLIERSPVLNFIFSFAKRKSYSTILIGSKLNGSKRYKRF